MTVGRADRSGQPRKGSPRGGALFSYGRLRSLHQYIDASGCGFAVRLHAGTFSLEDHATLSGKPFKLLNLPYFLAGSLGRCLDRFM
jgi:hypothetical protein